jgi:P-type conjugative transfer protein TrbG
VIKLRRVIRVDDAKFGNQNLRLLSKPEDYVARVAFAYPEDENSNAKWQEQLAKQKEQERKNTIAKLPGSSVDSLCFDYEVKGKNKALKPLRVFDDGQNTFIQISRETQTREAPVLVVLGGDGKQEMVNYRVKGDMYIVDRLFDRAELILGTGKKVQKWRSNVSEGVNPAVPVRNRLPLRGVHRAAWI